MCTTPIVHDCGQRACFVDMSATHDIYYCAKCDKYVEKECPLVMLINGGGCCGEARID